MFLSAALTACYSDTPPEDPEMVAQRLVALLADSDPDVRRTAAEALGKVGHRSASAGLIVSLNDRDASVRAAAALSLGRVGDGESGSALAERLADSDEAVRAASAMALGAIEISAVRESQILKVLHHPQDSARIAATRALLTLDTVSLSADLVGALHDSDAQVRQGVVAVLGETGDGGAVPHLLLLLRTDASAGVRAEAAFRLGKIGTSDVLADLSKAAMADLDVGVREWAGWAIQQIRLSREFGSRKPPTR
ncbi:MAG: HEAT repeat domain-containing protein [Nitrospira sp.]|nr:HEAT repeat domain-containing protein [Nitrospira sp.]